MAEIESKRHITPMDNLELKRLNNLFNDLTVGDAVSAVQELELRFPVRNKSLPAVQQVVPLVTTMSSPIIQQQGATSNQTVVLQAPQRHDMYQYPDVQYRHFVVNNYTDNDHFTVQQPQQSDHDTPGQNYRQFRDIVSMPNNPIPNFPIVYSMNSTKPNDQTSIFANAQTQSQSLDKPDQGYRQFRDIASAPTNTASNPPLHSGTKTNEQNIPTSTMSALQQQQQDNQEPQILPSIHNIFNATRYWQ